MLRQTLQLFVVVAGVAISTAAVAQQDWNVRGDAQREQKIVKRYRQLLLHNPDHAIAYRSLLAKLGRGPALDPLIADVRAVAEKGQQAEPYILLGHLERDRGHAAASLAAYQHAVKLEPDNAATHAALGSALDRAGRAAGANASFERALELTTSKRGRQKLLRRLCDTSLTRDDYVRAVQWMEAIVALRPSDFGTRIELAETQLRARQFDGALRSFEAAYERAGRSGKRRAQTLIDIGNIHRQMHDHVQAQTAYRRALKLIGHSSWMRREVLMRLLDVARDTGGLADMYMELQREWARPSYHDVMVLAGIAEELGRSDDAIKWLERAIRLDRRAIEPRTRLIARLDHDKDAERVKRLYHEIVALRPDDLNQRLERIEWLFLRARRADDALKELTELEREVAGDAAALVSIANTYETFGLPDTALRLHAELQQSAPDHLLHLEAYGRLLTRLGRLDEADAVWEHLFTVDTDEVGARLRVAEIAAHQGQLDRAIVELEWVVERYPRHVNARQRLAGVYETRKAWPEALAQWETLFFEYDVDHAKRRIIAIAQRTVFIGDDIASPDDELLARWERRYAADRRVRTGAVLIQLRSIVDNDVEAFVLAREIVELDPAELPVKERSAWVEVAQYMVRHAGSAKEAIELLARIADAFGERRAASWRKAIDLAVAGSFEVEDVLRRALDAAPNDAYIHATAGAVMADRGEDEQAIAHYRRAIALGTNSFDVHFDLALLLKSMGRDDQARAVYHTVMQTDWSGKWARGAAYSAVDLCKTDAHRRELVTQLDRLQGRLNAQDFFSIVTAVYSELFLYADDPAALFASYGRAALPRLLGAIQTDELGDRQHALKLLELYPTSLVVSTALRVWPGDAATWNEAMVQVLLSENTPKSGRAVLAALDSEQDDVREMALFAVGYLRLDDAVPALLAVLDDVLAAETDVALAAAGLGRIGTPDAVKRLGALSRDGDRAQRELAVWALAQGHNASAASLVAGHLSPRSGTGELAGTLLNASGDDGLRELLRAAWSADASRRAVARGGLRTSIDYYDPWSDLKQYDDAWDMRPSRMIETAIAAARTAPLSAAVARSFLGREQVVVEVSKEYLETASAVVLGDLLEAAREVEDAGMVELAPSLRTVVRGLRSDLRRLAKTAPTPTLAPAVMLLPLAEQQSDVELIAEAAARLPDEQAVAAFERLSSYPWKATRKALLNGMKGRDIPRRAAAIRAMARSEDAATDAEVKKLIVRLVSDPAPAVQAAAVAALGRLQQEDAVEMLTELHDDAQPVVQRAIRRTLRELPGAEAKAALRRFEVQATLPVCEGNPEDLSDLLEDDCAGAVQISDF